MEIYNVQRGDTLQSVAQKFGVSPQSIAEVNGLAPTDSLVVGMDLVIPSPNAAASKYRPFRHLLYSNSPYVYPMPAIQPNNSTFILQKPVIETLGYYTVIPSEDNTTIINTLGKNLTYLGIFEYPVTESGEIEGAMDSDVLKASQANQVAVMPVLTNSVEGEFSSDLGRTLISDTTVLNNFLNNIIRFLNQYNLKGVIIDFENLYPQDRNLFTNFIRLLSEKLHNSNKILILNMPQKWQDNPEKPWVGFFDYNALGPLVDIAAIMTYEWGYREGPPGPTAPLPFVKRSLDYALANNIPASKILMGMTLYGYDWELPDTPENLAATVTLPQVWNLARTYNAVIHFDDTAQQPQMMYSKNGIQHQVWFENARSHYLKYNLAKDYKLRGVFYWTLRMPFPSTWYILSEMFTIKKL